MKILYVASEAAPFIKTGGLADVAGSLPKAIGKAGHDIRVVLPNHGNIHEKYKKGMREAAAFSIHLGWRQQYVGVLEYKQEDITYYFLDNEYYFKRDRIYGEYDDGERYAYFSKAAAILPKILDFKPDIIHTNDWHTGLINVYVKDFSKGDDYYKDIRTLFTIHNLKYQGVFDAGILSDILGLSQEYFHEEGMKFFDAVNYMKAGIVYCDALNTVSKTYAREITYEFFGEQLEGILGQHVHKLTGIVNGIDVELYDPETDDCIAANYDSQSYQRKIENKKALQELYHLPIRGDIPLMAMITRLVPMKGMDLVKHVLDEILQEEVQFVILGTGEEEYQNLFLGYQELYPEQLSARIYFSEEEARLIYAGADMFLMPSMIEPCGISQLIALRYGTIPIVRETGGLKDTITPYNQYTKEGNGFSFQNFNAHELLFTIKNALGVYKNEKTTWEGLIKQGMHSKNDWNQSSLEYIQLYEKLKSN